MEIALPHAIQIRDTLTGETSLSYVIATGYKKLKNSRVIALHLDNDMILFFYKTLVLAEKSNKKYCVKTTQILLSKEAILATCEMAALAFKDSRSPV